MNRRRRLERVRVEGGSKPLVPSAGGVLLTETARMTGLGAALGRSPQHTFGTHTVKRGTKLRVVQQVLDHASLKTTLLYVQLTREDMDRQLQENAL